MVLREHNVKMLSLTLIQKVKKQEVNFYFICFEYQFLGPPAPIICGENGGYHMIVVARYALLV